MDVWTCWGIEIPCYITPLAVIRKCQNDLAYRVEAEKKKKANVRAAEGS